MDNNNNTAIIAKDYRLSDILSNKKYTVDYFQREYKWEQINIEQLVFDLVNAFMESYRPGDSLKDVAHYIKENLIAQAFCDATYQKNPGFLTFVKNNDLPFKSYADFKKQDIQDRCMLYAAIANLVWNKSLE